MVLAGQFMLGLMVNNDSQSSLADHSLPNALAQGT